MNGFFNTTRMIANIVDAITSRQKAIEKVSTSPKNRTKIEAVPKSIPAINPSVNASFRVRLKAKYLFHPFFLANH